jgi:RNA polymerase sigma-70 factor, ECF subfamily
LKPQAIDSRPMIDEIVRENYGKVLALLISQFKHFELAEDALQEAIVTAIENWSGDLMPDNRVAWLVSVSTRKAIDRIRRQTSFDNKSDLISQYESNIREPELFEDQIDDMTIPDERLRLIFTCCHPAIAEPTRIALTLKTLCGLTTEQIAHAFLVPELTLAQRLLRARHKVQSAGIRFELPDQSFISDRLNSVLNCIYLIFNEGYASNTGKNSIDHALITEALRLSAMLIQLMPGNTECLGLHCLMLFHQSRFTARLDQDGEPIDLQKQDRRLWNFEQIKTADKLLKATLMKGDIGSYQIQAAISAIHSHAAEFDTTDWPQIVMLYRKLLTLDDNPIIKLNMAVALSYAEDPLIALRLIDQLTVIKTMHTYHPYHVAKASCLERLQRFNEARSCYQLAIEHCNNGSQLRYLEKNTTLLVKNIYFLTDCFKVHKKLNNRHSLSIVRTNYFYSKYN